MSFKRKKKKEGEFKEKNSFSTSPNLIPLLLDWQSVGGGVGGGGDASRWAGARAQRGPDALCSSHLPTGDGTGAASPMAQNKQDVVLCGPDCVDFIYICICIFTHTYTSPPLQAGWG